MYHYESVGFDISNCMFMVLPRPFESMVVLLRTIFVSLQQAMGNMFLHRSNNIGLK